MKTRNFSKKRGVVYAIRKGAKQQQVDCSTKSIRNVEHNNSSTVKNTRQSEKQKASVKNEEVVKMAESKLEQVEDMGKHEVLKSTNDRKTRRSLKQKVEDKDAKDVVTAGAKKRRIDHKRELVCIRNPVDMKTRRSGKGKAQVKAVEKFVRGEAAQQQFDNSRKHIEAMEITNERKTRRPRQQKVKTKTTGGVEVAEMKQQLGDDSVKLAEVKESAVDIKFTMSTRRKVKEKAAEAATVVKRKPQFGSSVKLVENADYTKTKESANEDVEAKVSKDIEVVGAKRQQVDDFGKHWEVIKSINNTRGSAKQKGDGKNSETVEISGAKQQQIDPNKRHGEAMENNDRRNRRSLKRKLDAKYLEEIEDEGPPAKRQKFDSSVKLIEKTEEYAKGEVEAKDHENIEVVGDKQQQTDAKGKKGKVSKGVDASKSTRSVKQEEGMDTEDVQTSEAKQQVDHNEKHVDFMNKMKTKGAEDVEEDGAEQQVKCSVKLNPDKLKAKESSKQKVETMCLGTEDNVIAGAGAKEQQVDKSVKLFEAVACSDILGVIDCLQVVKGKIINLDTSTLENALQKAIETGHKRIVQMFLCCRVKASISMLHYAARRGFHDIVKMLIKRRVPVDATNSEGKTALMLAVQHSCCSPLVSFLMNNCSANPNIQDAAGKTALMMSVEVWDYESVQILLQSRRCDLDLNDKGGNTVFDLAEQNGSADLLKATQDSVESGVNPLIEVAASNSYDLVQKLIQINPDWAKQNSKRGLTPLAAALGGLGSGTSVAPRECDTRIVALLLKNKADVNTPHTVSGYTPLMLAAFSSVSEAARHLISNGAKVNAISKSDKKTALMLAAKAGSQTIVDMLIESGADVTHQDSANHTAFHHALKGAHKGCAKSLLLKCGKLTEHDLGWSLWNYVDSAMLELFLDEDVKFIWQDLMCPRKYLLTRAIGGNCYQLVVELIGYGVDVTSSNAIFAAINNISSNDTTRLPVLRLLLNKGADANAKGNDYLSTTVLIKAAEKGNVDAVKLLLEYNADMYITDYQKCTALCMACRNEHKEVATYLLDAGMDVNHLSEGGHPPLLCTLKYKSFDLTKLLIQRGANVNSKDSRGMPALHSAVHYCPSKFLELLINHGADINALDQHGETALHYAFDHNKNEEEKIKLLLQNGTDVNFVDSDHNNTFLQLAAQYSPVNIMQLLVDYGAGESINVNPRNSALQIVTRSSTAIDKLKVLLDNGADPNSWAILSQSPLCLALDGLKEDFVRCLVRSGASLTYAEKETQDQWSKYLIGLIRRYMRKPPTHQTFIKFVKCLEPLFETGCSLDYVRLPIFSSFFLKCIAANEQRILLLLIQAGHRPLLIKKLDVFISIPGTRPVIGEDKELSKVSYICSAILCGSKEAISVLASNHFYHTEDTKLLQNATVRSRMDALLSEWPSETMPPAELMPETWSLFTWSMLAVNKVIGLGHTRRESRIKALPIPRALQDKLLYKNIFLPESVNRGFKHGN